MVTKFSAILTVCFFSRLSRKMDQFEQKMQAAEQEGMKNMFLKLMDVCYERCVKGNYVSENIKKRELICTDELKKI